MIIRTYKYSMEDLKIERATWSVKRILNIAKDVADGMAYLSSVGIILRTLAPSNILLDSKNTALIGDYGLSRVLNFKMQGLMTRGVGIPYYEAPELMKSGNQSYGTEVDVFSFGVILWEFLTKRDPYDHLSPMAIESFFNSIVSGTRPQIDNIIILKQHPLLKEIIVTCWDGNATVRPTFEKLANQLGDYIIDME